MALPLMRMLNHRWICRKPKRHMPPVQLTRLWSCLLYCIHNFHTQDLPCLSQLQESFGSRVAGDIHFVFRMCRLGIQEAYIYKIKDRCIDDLVLRCTHHHTRDIELELHKLAITIADWRKTVSGVTKIQGA